MSKSKANIYYPSDLIKKGYKGEHIRFFLIYGHYRKRLNFTFERLRRTSQKLDSFRKMVDDLEKAKPGKSSKEAKKLVEYVITSFEKNMNNDLNAKGAFEDLFRIVLKLNTLKKEEKLNLADARRVVSNLKKIDRTLQIIFRQP